MMDIINKNATLRIQSSVQVSVRKASDGQAYPMSSFPLLEKICLQLTSIIPIIGKQTTVGEGALSPK